MKKGIRELAMSPESEDEPTSSPGFKPWPEDQYGGYPRSYDRDRYDGEYDGRTYNPVQKDDERKDIIKIELIITYAQMGPKFDMDNEQYEYTAGALEERAKELAYDRLLEILGTDFPTKYVLVLDPTDSYDEVTVEALLTPVLKETK